MQSLLMTKFNETTEGAFPIKLSYAEADIRRRLFTFVFIYPEALKEKIELNRENIEREIIKIVALNTEVKIKLLPSYFDESVFLRQIKEFFDEYPSVSPFITPDKIRIERDGENIKTTVSVEKSALIYLNERGAAKAFSEYTDKFYCQNIVLFFEECEGEVCRTVKDNAPQFILESGGARLIEVSDITGFVGQPVKEPASYIADCLRPSPQKVICGRIENYTELTSRVKEDGSGGKKFYKFRLSDFTGGMNCIFFPPKASAEKMSDLAEGKEVIISGEIKNNEFKGKTTLEMNVKNISFCVLPESFKENRIIRTVPEEYTTVFPQKYVSQKQEDLFGEEVTEIPQYIKGKTFCVFDVETTGIDASVCKIIEIGAVKIEDGKMTEVFSTYINPRELLSDKIKQLTNISDDNLKDAPFIEQVLPDFYKFCDGCILVGHNVTFDIGFLNASGKNLYIRFEHKYEDTYALAKKYVKGVNNYKLGSILKTYGIENEGAHRAIYDTLATAELFIKLAEYL